MLSILQKLILIILPDARIGLNQDYWRPRWTPRLCVRLFGVVNRNCKIKEEDSPSSWWAQLSGIDRGFWYLVLFQFLSFERQLKRHLLPSSKWYFVTLRYVTKQDVYNTNLVWHLHGFHAYNTKKDLDNVV